MTRRVLIACGYSTRNAGDALLVRNLCKVINDMMPSATITIGSVTPELDAPIYGYPCEAPPFDPRRPWVGFVKGGLSRAIGLRGSALLVFAAFLGWLMGRRARRVNMPFDLVVAAPGGYLMAPKWYNVDWLHQVSTLFSASIAGVPLVMAPMSIGPFAWPHGLVLKPILEWATAILCRDQASVDLSLRLNPRSRSVLSPDAAFISARQPQSHNDPAVPGMDESAMGSTGWVGFSVRPFSFPFASDAAKSRAGYEHAVLASMRAVVERGCRPVVIPQTTEDVEVSKRIVRLAQGLGVEAHLATIPVSVEELTAVYARLDLVIATRMHAGLMAMLSGTPAIFIEYEPKTSGVLAALGNPPPVVSIYSPAELPAVVARAMADPPKIGRVELQALGDRCESTIRSAIGAATAGRSD